MFIRLGKMALYNNLLANRLPICNLILYLSSSVLQLLRIYRVLLAIYVYLIALSLHFLATASAEPLYLFFTNIDELFPTVILSMWKKNSEMSWIMLMRFYQSCLTTLLVFWVFCDGLISLSKLRFCFLCGSENLMRILVCLWGKIANIRYLRDCRRTRCGFRSSGCWACGQGFGWGSLGLDLRRAWIYTQEILRGLLQGVHLSVISKWECRNSKGPLISFEACARELQALYSLVTLHRCCARD